MAAPRRIVILGVEYPTGGAAARALGVPRPTFQRWLKRTAGDQESLDATVRERTGAQAAKGAGGFSMAYQWRGKWYATVPALLAAANCPGVTPQNIKRAKYRGVPIEDFIEGRIRLARRLRVGDRQFKTRAEIAEWLERPLQWVVSAWAKGATAESLAIQCGMWTRPEYEPRKGTGRIPKIARPVAWSGWRWPSMAAFATYYFDDARTKALREFRAGRQELWQAMMQRLIRLWERGALDARNRFVDESRIPEWARPINPDDREGVADYMERQLTPDLAERGQSGEHLSETARRELLERGAAARRLLDVTDSRKSGSVSDRQAAPLS